MMAFVILTSEASADVRMKPGRPPNDSWPRLVRQTILTDLTFSAPVLLDSDAPDDVDFANDEEDSRKARWQPSQQLINIFEPSPPAMRRDGDESRVDVVRILMDVVILLFLSSPQSINIFEPSPPAMRRDGDESRVDVVRTLMDVVVLLPDY